MPPIFVNTDNSNINDKLYRASKLGKSAAAAEKVMQDGVIAAVGKSADFTTDKSKSAKGYTLKLDVVAQTSAGKTTVSLNIVIERYPDGDAVQIKVHSGTGTVNVSPEKFPLDTLQEIAQGAATKALPVMRIDMTRR